MRRVLSVASGRASAIAGALALVACTSSEVGTEAVSQEEYRRSTDTFLATQEQHAHAIARCLRDEGFPVEVTEDFGVLPPEDVDTGLSSRYREVGDRCTAEVIPPYERPTTDQIERHFRLLLAAAECLESHGFDVPEPSTMAAFVDGYERLHASTGEDVDVWSPYDLVLDRLDEAYAACPHPAT